MRQNTTVILLDMVLSDTKFGIIGGLIKRISVAHEDGLC